MLLCTEKSRVHSTGGGQTLALTQCDNTTRVSETVDGCTCLCTTLALESRSSWQALAKPVVARSCAPARALCYCGCNSSCSSSSSTSTLARSKTSLKASILPCTNASSGGHTPRAHAGRRRSPGRTRHEHPRHMRYGGAHNINNGTSNSSRCYWNQLQL